MIYLYELQACVLVIILHGSGAVTLLATITGEEKRDRRVPKPSERSAAQFYSAQCNPLRVIEIHAECFVRGSPGYGAAEMTVP